MKIFTYFLLFISITTQIYSQWTKCNNGLDKIGTINALEVSGNNIFAGTTNKGMFLSTNNGDNWTQINTGYTATWVNSIAISDTTIFAASMYDSVNSGVFLSTNNGGNWTKVKEGGTSCLAINGNNIFAGGDGIYLSTNNGGTWTEVDSGLPNKFITCVIAKDAYIYAGISDYGLFMSPDNGSNWKNIHFFPNISVRYIEKLAICGNNIFACISGTGFDGIYNSTNYGNNWRYIINNTECIYSICIRDNIIAAGTYTDLIFSSDCGYWWKNIRGDMPLMYVTFSLAINNQYIFAGTGDGVVFRAELKNLLKLSLDKINDVFMKQDTSVKIYIPIIVSKPDSLQTTIISDNTDLLPPDSLKATINDTSHFLNITPVKGKSGVSNITLKFKNGGDSVSTTFKVTVNKPADVKDINLNNTITIYPNPAESRLSIVSNNNVPLGKIEIYNLFGAKVLAIEEQNNRTEIDISSFPAGIYLVRIGDYRKIFIKN